MTPLVQCVAVAASAVALSLCVATPAFAANPAQKASTQGCEPSVDGDGTILCGSGSNLSHFVSISTPDRYVHTEISKGSQTVTSADGTPVTDGTFAAATSRELYFDSPNVTLYVDSGTITTAGSGTCRTRSVLVSAHGAVRRDSTRTDCPTY